MVHFTVLFHLGSISNLTVSCLEKAMRSRTPFTSRQVSRAITLIPKPPSDESGHMSLEGQLCSFASLLLARSWSRRPASLRQAVCKGTSQLAWPRLINDERQAGFQVHKSHSGRVGQRLPQSQLAGRSLWCLVLAKFPEPDGTGGESILGLPGQPDLNEWQVVLFERQCGFLAT